MICFDPLFEVYQRLPTFPGCDTPPVFGSCRAAGVVGGGWRVSADLGRGMPGALGTGGGGRRPVHGAAGQSPMAAASERGRARRRTRGRRNQETARQQRELLYQTESGRAVYILLDTSFRLAEQLVGTTGRFWRPGVERQCGWERFGSTVARHAPSGWWTVTSSTSAR